MAALLARRSSATGIRFFLLHYNSHLSCKPHCVSSSSFSQQLLYFSSSNSKQSSLGKPASSTAFFIDKYHFSPQVASKVASISAGMKNPQNPDLILSFLREQGFSNPQLENFMEKLIRRDSRLACSSVENRIKPNFKMFQDFGFSATEVIDIIASNPGILFHGATVRSLSVLKDFAGSNSRLIKLLKKIGNYFVDLEKNMLPNIEFLKSYGVPMGQMNSLILTFPRFFLVNPDTMRKYVHKVDEMGVERTSKSFIYAVRSVSMMSDETWELKLKTFRDLGFSEDDILRVFRSVPMVFTVSIPKFKKVKEVILEIGKYDMSCIVNDPHSLMLSVEKRFKPRLQVLNLLENKGLIKKWPSLSRLCTMSDEIFSHEAFIAKTSLSRNEETEAYDHK